MKAEDIKRLALIRRTIAQISPELGSTTVAVSHLHLLVAALEEAEAVNAAHSLGWIYDDDAGAWYDESNRELQCLDEDLVECIAALRKP